MQSSENANSIESNNSQQPYEQNTTNTITQLNHLVSETLQIYELENQKINSINELYNSLKTITEFLKFSINIHPLIFNLSEDTVILLIPNLDIIFKKSNSKTVVKSFSDLPPDVVIKVLEYMIPQIVELINTEKSDLTNKVTFLREITKQLHNSHMLTEHITTETGNKV